MGNSSQEVETVHLEAHSKVCLQKPRLVNAVTATHEKRELTSSMSMMIMFGDEKFPDFCAGQHVMVHRRNKV